MSGMGAAGFVEHQRVNKRATFVLLFGTFVLLFVVVNTAAAVLGGYTQQDCVRTGPTVADQLCTSDIVFRPTILGATVFAVVIYLLVAYFASARAALAMNHAVPANGPEFAGVRELVSQMAIAAGLPEPSVYVVYDPAPNAFATGRNPSHATVTVTTGLLAQLSHRELRGVIAHELAHIKNRDIAVTTLAVLAVGLIAFLAQMSIRVGLVSGRGRSGQLGLLLLALGLLMYVLAVPAGLLLKAALSRRREALADATAIEMTREPYGLRSALEKLEANTTVLSNVRPAAAHLWIESPLERGQKQGMVGSIGRLFNTHPPLSERIALLRGYEGLDPQGRGPIDPLPPPAPRPPQPTAQPTAQQPGWYPDHNQETLLRWWDGSSWTSHTAKR